MSYSIRQQQSSSQSYSGNYSQSGYGGGAGGGNYAAQCGVGGIGQGAGFSQGAGFGQVAGFGQMAGFGQGAGYGQGAGSGQGASFSQGGGGFGFGGGQDAGFGFGGNFGGGDNIFTANEKQTMQNLNDRLANYLDQVRKLEEANADLEKKIKEFYEKQRGTTTTGESKDYSKYFTTIEELKTSIVKATNDNASLVLQIDNARLAADDFKMKYENELALRHSVEADINGLRRVMDDLTLTKSDMENQLESLTEELTLLKKNHEDDIKGSHETTVGDVKVEMDAAPGNDLLKSLNDMRQQYEALAEKNRREAEEQFRKRSEGLKKEITVGVEQVQTSKSEISELRKTLQALEIELQSQLAMKKSLDETLAQTEGSFCMKLSHIQAQIASIEEQLSQIRDEIECQTSEYTELLDIKTKLEAEIAQYQKLLDGGSSIGGTAAAGGQTSTTKDTGSTAAAARGSGYGSSSGTRR
ncbi:keratin-3, type I cytoskeletal 51 kDa-like isoform X2 [Hyperolius riggenbachi]|uniref:keratin-3, type I cytoskeletal 51 kDa-like isoform X1 n=1 Tax=Hyperolius riggenbachi TaxID=752182 RepID=UPI0035A29447